MIKIICGPKGTGKTKIIIDEANKAVKEAKGHVIFVTDTDRYRFEVDRNIRLINTKEFNIAGEDALCGFLKGIVSANYDNEYLFVDGIARIAGKSLGEMASLFYMLDKVSTDLNLTITITCSCAKDDLPDFIAKYL